MDHKLYLHNTLSRKKELFEPINPPFVGMYVCGPTVYGDAHLGHLENDADEGEDKIAKKARLEQIEPMEVVQYFTERYHHDMEMLNVLSPGIEPRASGHIIEQIEMIEKIFDSGLAYESKGSVYFDVEKYNKHYHYGKLSGRKLDDLMSNTRELEGQEEKRNPYDFALWKKAQPEHIMRWPSRWSKGFPGWHLECSAMSARYLGERFDIHGGGMDLLFPHHESEIAQSVAANDKDPVKYWLHNNMITINGQKMGKSLGNFITLGEFFSGQHKALTKAFSPMTIRFFILQAHYRSTLDFSNEALIGAEKGLDRLMKAWATLAKLVPSEKSSVDVITMRNNCYEAMNDDFNSPIVIANLFEGVRIINSVNDQKESLSAEDLALLRNTFDTFISEILGLKQEDASSVGNSAVEGLMELVLELRKNAKTAKDFSTSDKIRDELSKIGINVKDTKEGATWSLD